MAEKRTAKVRAVAKQRSVRQLNGFLGFIREQGVIGLAIGFVMGAAAATLVKSLIDNVLMPPLGILVGSANGLKGLSANLGRHGGKEVVLNYGIFLNDLVNFLILALAVYVMVKVLRLDRLDKKKG
jgi:large conductance mechanosensitive channel